MIGVALIGVVARARSCSCCAAASRRSSALAAAMERVDLARPARATVAAATAGSREVARLTSAFNRMLDRLEDERRQAGQAAVRAQERERARIARDLHDEVNQALTGDPAAPRGLDPARARRAARRSCAETKRLATQAMEELLRLARELRPTALDDHGLVAALRTQVRTSASDRHRAALRTPRRRRRA